VSEFLTSLRVEETDELKGLWTLLADFSYRSDLLGRVLTVPQGFVTDFASVPRLPFVYLAAGGKGDKAAVIHDWAYSTQFCDRATADKLLREAMLACGYSEFSANAFYVAVRSFGESHWDKPNNDQPQQVQAAMEAESLLARI
jgi:hypothetical protein